MSDTSESVDADPQSHPAVSLNVDIMHVIMSYARRSVVSKLMKICSTLNREGTRYLFKDEVSFRHYAELVSFFWFLKARGDSSECFRRLTFLNKLSLDFKVPTEDISRTLEMLFEIVVRLGAASNLTSLKIFQAEYLLTPHPPLATAIAKLTTLKTLNLQYTGEHCATLLRTLQSSLVSASLYFGLQGRDREHEAIPEPDTNPLLLLEGSQTTLESLDATFALSSPSPDVACYANVTCLHLSCMDLPFIEDYIRAFPNLLSLTTFECAGYRDDPVRWHARRRMSMLYQARYGTWHSLRHFRGSMLVLWNWGLTCNIASIEMSFERQYEVDSNFLNDIILDTHPSHLSLRLPGASCLLDDAVRAVLSEEGRLQTLELCVLFQIAQNDDTVSVRDILDLLVDVVRASSVPKFKLILDLSYMRIFRFHIGDEGLPLMPFEIYLRDMDVDAYADNLFAGVPSLKEVQVSVKGPQDDCMRQADRKRTAPHGQNTANTSSQYPKDETEQ